MFKLLSFSHNFVKTQLIFNEKYIKSQFYPWSIKDDFNLWKGRITKDDLITKLPLKDDKAILPFKKEEQQKTI